MLVTLGPLDLTPRITVIYFINLPRTMLARSAVCDDVAPFIRHSSDVNMSCDAFYKNALWAHNINLACHGSLQMIIYQLFSTKSDAAQVTDLG